MNNSIDNYPILDAFFLVEGAGGRSAWKVLRTCPKAPRDVPLKR